MDILTGSPSTDHQSSNKAVLQQINPILTKQLLLEDSTQYHLPYHNYAGPGTNTIKNLLNNVQPTTYIDRAALIHDIEYIKPGNQLKADRNMITNMDKAFLLGKPIHQIIAKVFIAKNIIGYNPPTDIQLYEAAKAYVKQKYDLKGMRFSDDV